MDVSLPFDATQALSPVDARRVELLDQLINLAANAANAQVDSLCTSLCDAFQQRSARASSPAEAAQYGEAATLLKQNRYPFFYVTSARIRAALEHEVRTLAPTLPFAAIEPLTDIPKLAPDLDVDKKMSLIKLAGTLEGRHARALEALGKRLGALLGTEPVIVAQNPFAPLVLLNALHDAWCEFHPDPAAHHLQYPVLSPGLCIDAEPVLDKCNTLLVKHGILPTIHDMGDTIVVTPDAMQTSAPARLKPATNDPALVALKRLFGEDDTKAPTAQVKGDFPALLGDTMLGERHAHDVLLDQVALLQKQYHAQATINGAMEAAAPRVLLGQLKQQAPADGWPQADVVTIDMMIHMFESVLDDPHLPTEIRTLIGTLQLPLLKAALQDREFFFSDTHPARRAIQLLAQLGVGCDMRRPQTDEQYQLVLRNVKRIQSDQRAPSFALAVADMEAYLAQEDKLVAQTLEAPISQALQREKTLVAAKTAKHDVAMRIGTGEVVAFVETFLEDKWVSVLTLAYTLKDDKPEAVSSAVTTMDDLCWSVKPKISLEERKELIAKLPSIVRRLNKWLDAVMWHDEARVEFFDQLARCHASIVRAPIELSPERQLQIAMKIAQKATERRLRREARQAARERQPDAFDAQVRDVARDSWVQFVQSNGVTVKLKLAWISPTRSLYIFATRERKEAFSLTDEEFAGALREKRAVILSVADLVACAVHDTIKPASNDSLVAAPTAA